MKKTIITYGLLAGLLAAFMIVLNIVGIYHYDGPNAMLIGYGSMIISFSLIFVAITKYRDNELGGVITFGKAFKIGIMISLIASTMYVGAWLIDYFFVNPDFFEKYSALELAKMKAKGATDAQLAAKTEEYLSMGKMYKNPFFNALMTYCEILPVGVLFSLLAAAILKRKEK